MVAFQATVVRAQERFDLQNFRPAPGQLDGGLTTHGAIFPDDRRWELHLMGSLGYSPFALMNSADEVEGKLVSTVGSVELLGQWSFGNRFALGFDLPVRFMGAGDPIPGFSRFPLGEDATSLGDIRLVPVFSLAGERADRGTGAGWGLALYLDGSLPTGDQSTFTGDGPLRAELGVSGGLHSSDGHRLTVNLGGVLRPTKEIATLEVTSGLALRADGEYRLSRALSLIGDLNGAMMFAEDAGPEERPLEWLGGMRLRSGEIFIQAAGGTALSGGVGSTDWRVVTAIGFSRTAEPPPVAPPDRDGDGIADASDACPGQPEDIDGNVDHDGCPEQERVDTDTDGIEDSADGCVNEPEDRDGRHDEDGCPEEEPDRDGDGVIDEEDECPDEPGLAQRRGCPAPPEPEVFTATPRFSTGSAEIGSRARQALDALLAELGDRAGEATFEIEGHTDDTGEDELNRELSRERAQAVRDYLIEHGVDPGRITISHYGSSRPLASGTDDSTRERNRRAEVRAILPVVDGE